MRLIKWLGCIWPKRWSDDWWYFRRRRLAKPLGEEGERILWDMLGGPQIIRDRASTIISIVILNRAMRMLLLSHVMFALLRLNMSICRKIISLMNIACYLNKKPKTFWEPVPIWGLWSIWVMAIYTPLIYAAERPRQRCH